MGALQIISNLVEFIRSFFRAAFGWRDEGQGTTQATTLHVTGRGRGQEMLRLPARLVSVSWQHHITRDLLGLQEKRPSFLFEIQTHRDKKIAPQQSRLSAIGGGFESQSIFSNARRSAAQEYSQTQPTKGCWIGLNHPPHRAD
jgi:hypothetical protein